MRAKTLDKLNFYSIEPRRYVDNVHACCPNGLPEKPNTLVTSDPKEKHMVSIKLDSLK